MGLREDQSTMRSQRNNCVLPNGTQLIWEDDDDLKVLPEGERIALLTVAIVLCAFCAVGNCAAVFSVIRRKLRLLYKCCLISLAVSDLLLGLSYSVIYIPKFVQKYSNDWVLGGDMCSFGPLLTTMCLLINSMTISCIALDRYQAVRVGAKKRWEPNLWVCLACMLLIWSACAGTATPMYSMYSYIGPIYPVTVNCNILPHGLHFCLVFTKDFKIQYYLSVYALIFLPLFVTFVGLYVVVAMYVWKQRIPISKRAPAQTSSNETVTTCTSKNDNNMYKKASTKTSPTYVINTTSNTGSRSTLMTDSSSGTPINRRRQNDDNASGTPPAEPPVRTTHSKRKVRTFKVIMVLIAACFIGRVPSWTYTVIQSDPHIRLAEMQWWLLQYWLTILILFSTALNPFLYCFLNETLDFIQGVFRFIRNIFEYCCFSWQKRNKINVETDRQQIVVEQEQVRSVSIVPRGPYLNDEEERLGAPAVSAKVNHI